LLLLPSLESSLSPRWKPSPSLSSLSSSRSQRQSDGNHHFFSLNQPYYTRPEDFSIPSYSPPKAGESKERSFVPPSLLSQTSLGFFPPSSHISPPASKPRFQYPQSFPYPYETPSIHPTPPPSSTPPLSPPSSTPSSSTRVPSPSLSPTGPTGPEGSSRVPTDSSSSYSLSSSEGPSRGTTDSSSSYSHSSPEGSSKGRTDSSSSSYSPSRLRPGYANPSPPGGNAPFPSYPTLNPTTQNHNPYEGDGYTTNAYTVPSTNGYSTPVSSPPAYVPPNHKTGSEYESSPEGVSTVPHGVTTVPHGVSTVPRGVSTVPHEVSTVPHGVSSPPAYVPPNYKTGSEYESSPEVDYSNPSSNRILSIPSYSESSSHNSSPIPSSSSNSFSPSSPLQNGYESESDTTPFLPDSTQSDRSSSSSPSDAYDNSDSSIPSTSKSTHSPTSSNGSPSTPPNTSRIPNVHPTLASDSTHNYRNPSGDNSNPYGPPQSPTDIPHSNPTVSPSSHTGPLPSPSSGIYSVDFIPRTPKPSNISIYSPPRGGPKFMIHNETGSPAPPASNPYSFFSTVSPGEASTVSYDLPPPPPGSKEETPLRTNRIKGMAHILCMDSDTMRGVEVNALTVFPFEGTVSTLLNGKKECEKKFESNSGSTNVSVFFPYEECGLMKQNPDGSTEWDVQVLFTFPSSEESFLVQCQSQSIKYDKGSVPRRFEESLEEFQLIPIKIEQKAPLPTVLWSLTENNSTEVDIGTSQVMYFNLTPETEAYGFHVKNCFVIDEKSGDRHPVIDRKGCSSDMAAFTHPQYNTLDDTITSDWMAFKLPDHDSLHISCSYSICPDFPSSSGDNSSFCSTIPTPPLCPRTVATPFNSLSSYQALTKRDAAVEMTQRVEASLPILDSSPPSVQFTSFSLFSFILIPTLSSTSILIACALHFASRRF
ncbi:hypothetical protein PENTCL1PPCAC_20122, partial [Pristionchus entomophagus]